MVKPRNEIPDEDSVYTGIPEDLYHSDRGSLSATGAKLLLQSPAKFRWQQDNPRKSTAAFDFGHLAHKLVLGEGAEIVVIEAADYRTKAAQEQRDAAQAAGKIPALHNEYSRAVGLADQVLCDPVAGPLFEHGHAEVSAYMHDTVTGVRLRCRFDWVVGNPEDYVTIVDLKTTQDAEPGEFSRSAVKYGYHLSAAWYIGVACDVFHTTPDRVRFLLVAAEKEAPHLVSVTEWDHGALEHGDQLCRQAIDLYHHCSSTDTWPAWPGHDAKVHPIHLPAWMRRSSITTNTTDNNDLIAALEAALTEGA